MGAGDDLITLSHGEPFHCGSCKCHFQKSFFTPKALHILNTDVSIFSPAAHHPKLMPFQLKAKSWLGSQMIPACSREGWGHTKQCERWSFAAAHSVSQSLLMQVGTPSWGHTGEGGPTCWDLRLLPVSAFS